MVMNKCVVCRHGAAGEEVGAEEESQIGLRRALVSADEAAAKSPAAAGDDIEEIPRPGVAGAQASTSTSEEDRCALSFGIRIAFISRSLVIYSYHEAVCRLCSDHQAPMLSDV